jgi:glutamyl-tRNA synthetase
MTEEQLINAFSLNKISPKPAVFDVEKLLWFNSQFIANMPLDDLLNETLFWLNNYGKNHLFNNVDEDYISQVLALSKTRLRTISDLFTDFKYYFQHPTDYDEKGVIKYFGLPDLADKFSALYSDFESLSDFKAGNLENLLRSRCDCWKISAADMIHPLRLALTGLTVSPGLFELMEVLGKERVLYRINKVIEYLNSINKTQNCK